MSDAYLGAIERRLMRSGYNVSRYADDFKVSSPTWSKANQVIEEAAEEARGLGLTLSTGKTIIRKRSTVDRLRVERTELSRRYFANVTGDRSAGDLTPGEYRDGDVGDVSVPTDNLREGARQLLRVIHEPDFT